MFVSFVEDNCNIFMLIYEVVQFRERGKGSVVSFETLDVREDSKPVRAVQHLRPANVRRGNGSLSFLRITEDREYIRRALILDVRQHFKRRKLRVEGAFTVVQTEEEGQTNVVLSVEEIEEPAD